MREITWVRLIDRGARVNPTFKWGALQAMFDYLGEYWAIRGKQLTVPNARVKFICSASVGGPGWAAWANRSRLEIRISPVFNFGGSMLTCVTAMVHEFMHLAGGNHHSSVQSDIMSPALEPGEQITQRDAQYMTAYDWRGARRPWNEPLYFRQKFTTTMELQSYEPVLLEFPGACIRDRTWQEWYNGIGSVVSKVVD